MAQIQPFNVLDLMKMSQGDRDCVFENRFLLAGNFEEEDQPINRFIRSAANSFVADSIPFKIQFPMVLLCLEGYMRVKLNLNEYRLCRNSLSIITPGSIGQCVEISDSCRVVLVAFSSDYVFTEENSEEALIIRKFLSRQSLLQLTDTQTSEVLAIYRAMRNKLRQPDFRFKREMLKGYLQVLYSELCQAIAPCVEQQDARPGSHQKRLFDRFIEELRQHYTRERSIRFYADRLCLTPKYLSQVVHAVSGRHAGEWIRDYVILEAKALLKSGCYTVQQVSDMLNFANQSFFGVYFKKAVGCSPTAYKEL